MCTSAMRAIILMPGISVPVARLRLTIEVARSVFPGIGAPTRWSEMTGFPVRHQY
jgi:hypothetical protein